MLELYFKYTGVIARFRSGALGNEIDRIAASLLNAGYKRDSAKLYLARIARFSTYATECGCRRSMPIPPRIVDRYLQARPTTAARWATHAALCFAARCFPERFSTEPPQEDRDRPLLTAYMQHLRVVRGLHPKTCEGLALTARRMLAWQRQHLLGMPLAMLGAKHVLVMTRDLLSGCRTDSARSSTTSHMRSFLHYIYRESLNTDDLAHFVPKTPCWRHAHLPARLPWEDVRRAIDSIESTTPSGIRDRAIMLLLATTGMRNRELRELELDDIRWRNGELLLRHTKGRHDVSRRCSRKQVKPSLNTFFTRDRQPPTAGCFFRAFRQCARSLTAASRALCVSGLSARDSTLNVVVHIFYATASRHDWLRSDDQSRRLPIYWVIGTSIARPSTSRSLYPNLRTFHCRFPEVRHEHVLDCVDRGNGELHCTSASAGLSVSQTGRDASLISPLRSLKPFGRSAISSVSGGLRHGKQSHAERQGY